MPQSTAGLILAGGEGHRWGGPKAWAELPDRHTFLDACAAALLGGGCRPVVATLPPAETGPVPTGIDAVSLPASGIDMFGSLRIGLTALADVPWGAVVVLPVDHPLVRARTIRALAEASGPASIPRLEGRHGHPIRLAREVAERIISGDLPGPTLREVLREVGAEEVAVDDPGIRANCNTPERLREAWSTRRPPPR